MRRWHREIVPRSRAKPHTEEKTVEARGRHWGLVGTVHCWAAAGKRQEKVLEKVPPAWLQPTDADLDFWPPGTMREFISFVSQSPGVSNLLESQGANRIAGFSAHSWSMPQGIAGLSSTISRHFTFPAVLEEVPHFYRTWSTVVCPCLLLSWCALFVVPWWLMLFEHLFVFIGHLYIFLSSGMAVRSFYPF